MDTRAFWRDGDDLVVRDGAVLPDICVITGRVGGNVRVTRSFRSPSVEVGAFVLMPIPLAPSFGNRVTVTYAVNRRDWLARWACILGGVVGCVVSLIAAWLWDDVALLGVMASWVFAMLARRLFGAARVEHPHVVLRPKPPFMASLDRLQLESDRHQAS